MPILYVETNFLIAIATGRDQHASGIITSPPPNFRLAIPGICFFEALNWREEETKRSNRFVAEINNHINESDRDLYSSHAQWLRTNLAVAILEKQSLLAETDNRLGQAIEELSARGEILNLTAETLIAARSQPLIGQLSDNLILHSILEHARSQTDPTKAFLTENHRDFSKAIPELKAAGVAYFSKTEDFLGWASGRSSLSGL